MPIKSKIVIQIMRDTNINMVRLVECGKQNGGYFGRVSIILDEKEVSLTFGIDHYGYTGIKNALQFRPFDNFTNEPYRHFFAGSYNKEAQTMSIRVEQGKTHKQFYIKSSNGLIANLIWFSQIENISQVQHLLD